MNRIEDDDSLATLIKKMSSLDGFVKLAFWVSLLVVIALNLMNVAQPLLEEHAFRQTQTALTSYYLAQNGFSFRYETPVVGEGWSIPFEFPIYQYLVALISSLLGVSLTITGRVVSLFFVVGCCIPVAHTLRRLGIDQRAIYFSLALFITSPIYLFWSGTFMIEGPALFFTCCFGYYALKVMQRSFFTTDLVLLGLFLTLALLQKVTTPLPLLGACILYGVLFRVRVRDLAAGSMKILGVVASFAVPLVLAYVWVKFSDVVKAQNPIGEHLTSASLSVWNYGSLSQRLSKELWLDVIFNRNVKTTTACGLGVVFIALALAFVEARRVRLVILGGVFFFVLPFMVFSNLHFVHNYYQSANAVFLSVAVGVAVVAVSNYLLPRSPVAYSFLLLVFLASNGWFFYKGYYPQKSRVFTGEERTLAVASLVQSETPKDRPVIWYGFDWSSEVAFYSERRSLTVPNWGEMDVRVVEDTKSFLSQNPSAIVLCPTRGRDEAIMEAIARKYGAIQPREVAGCRVYFI
ncbi:MAG: hypothetical protein L6Q69_09075 [Zoogloea sp.]|nr:hypothetical protein [Zoogloea sp.]